MKKPFPVIQSPNAPESAMNNSIFLTGSTPISVEDNMDWDFVFKPYSTEDRKVLFGTERMSEVEANNQIIQSLTQDLEKRQADVIRVEKYLSSQTIDASQAENLHVSFSLIF